ncbi:hypothetical protein GCM10009672_13330 [Nesterenkonia lutea]
MGRRSQSPRASGIRIERLLGVGGTCAVWLGTRTGAEEPDWDLVDVPPPGEFALKIPLASADRSHCADAAAAELQALHALRHEHLVRAYGTVQTSHGLALLLEPCCGGSLGSVLSRAGRLEIGEVITVLTPIATALSSLHRQGVVHGDVSPGNILLGPDGRSALGDLADAQALGTAGPGVGTPGFAAPEAADRRWRTPDGGTGRLRQGPDVLAPAADVYSLAAVAWFALCGSLPARGDRRAPLPSLRPETPDAMVLLLESALQEDPALRPSAEDFAVRLFACAAAAPLDLTPYVDEEVVPELPTARGQVPRGGRRMRAGLAAALAGVLVLAGFGGWVLAMGPEKEGAESTRAARSLDADDSADRTETSSADPRDLLRLRDPAMAVQGIAELRTRALTHAERDLVQHYTVEGSPAAAADEALVGRFRDQGMRYAGEALQITVHSADPEPGSAPSQSPRVELEVTVRATPAGSAAADSDAADSDAADSEDAESQQVVLALQRSRGQWLLHSVEESG